MKLCIKDLSNQRVRCTHVSNYVCIPEKNQNKLMLYWHCIKNKGFPYWVNEKLKRYLIPSVCNTDHALTLLIVYPYCMFYKQFYKYVKLYIYFINISRCGIKVPPAGCHLEISNNKTYPACCNNIVCPQNNVKKI